MGDGKVSVIKLQPNSKHDDRENPMNRLLHLAIFALFTISVGCSDKAPSYLDEIRERADKGDAEAQNRLGEIYAIGQGVEQDRVEASRWFRRAAMQGEPERSVAGTFAIKKPHPRLA